MKSTIILLTFAGLLIGCAAKQAAAPPAAPAPEPAVAVTSVDVRLGKLIAVDRTTFTLKNEADTERFEKAVVDIWNPAYARHVPGLQILGCKGDRGVNAGRYVQISNFDTQERRDYYYPVPDASLDEYPVAAAALEPLNAELAEKFEFTLADFVQSDTVRTYTDYVLVGGDQVPEMPLVGLLGIHDVKVKEGMGEAFDAFITDKWYPASLGQIPGFCSFIYKGDRGANIGGYIWVNALDSPSRRDAYWPESDSASEAWTEAWRPFEELFNEANSYFVPADTTAGEPVDTFTDWVIIK